MATSVGVRKILDLKRFEICAPAPVATGAGTHIISSRHYRQQQLLISSATVHYLYHPGEDGWTQIPSGALTPAIAAGGSGTATAVGPSGTASGGTTSTVNTTLNLQRDLRGYSIHITAGPGAGETKVIASNTIGANSIITIVGTFGTSITASSIFRLLTPRFYVLTGGTLASGSFKYYDFATNTWSAALSIAGLAATLGTDGRLVATPSWMDDAYKIFGTGTASAGAASTLTDSTKAWTTNQWANSQVRIVSGTGAGQIRTIASNTGTVLTTSAAWTTNPDNTSVYAIEGNDDFLYYLGNGAVTLYRYSISGNTWSTLSPGVARGGAASTGMSAHWIWDTEDAAWNTENAILNGRYIYSFRGAGGTLLDRYDIAANSWANVPYAPQTETFTSGTKWTYHGNYIYCQKDATGRFFRYNVVTAEQDGFASLLYTQGAAVIGDTLFDVNYRDGATEITWLYLILNTSAVMLRVMVI